MGQLKTVQTNNAPAAIGPYSQAIRRGNTVYLSGQIPLDPKTMIGAQASNDQLEKILSYIEKGERGGAKCLTGGERFGDEFTYHVILTKASPMIHFTRSRRPEVVLFGRDQRLTSPAVGESEEEVRRLIAEAIEFHLDGLREEGTAIPEPHSQVEYVEVKSAE